MRSYESTDQFDQNPGGIEVAGFDAAGTGDGEAAGRIGSVAAVRITGAIPGGGVVVGRGGGRVATAGVGRG